MQPNTRLNKEDCDKNPTPDFHRRYRGIVGSLGYLVTMSRPDLAWAYSELSKYVQFPGKNHMLAAEHVLCYLRGTWNQTIRYSRDSHENPNEMPHNTLNVYSSQVLQTMQGTSDMKASRGQRIGDKITLTGVTIKRRVF